MHEFCFNQVDLILFWADPKYTELEENKNAQNKNQSSQLDFSSSQPKQHRLCINSNKLTSNFNQAHYKPTGLATISHKLTLSNRTSDSVKQNFARRTKSAITWTNQVDFKQNQVNSKLTELEEFSCQVDLIEYQASSKIFQANQRF